MPDSSEIQLPKSVIEGRVDTVEDERKKREEELALINKLESWFADSKRWTSDQRKRWRYNEKLIENEVEIPGPDAATKIRLNLARSVINSMMAIIADYLPTFDVMPMDDNDVQFADMLQKRKKQIEKAVFLKDKLLDAIRDSKNYSNGLIYVGPIHKKMVSVDENGKEVEVDKYQGIEVENVDPFTWYPAAGSKGMDIKKEALYHIFATPKHVDWIKRVYKVKVSPEGYLDDERAFNYTGSEGQASDSGQVKSNMSLCKEAYFMDEDEEAYPNGRMVLWIGTGSGGHVIYDEAMDYPRIPYFMIGNHKSPHKLFGQGEPDITKTIIKAMNQVMSSIADNINKTGNPVRKIKKSWWNQAKRKILGKVAGEDVVVNSMDDIQYMEVPNVPAYTFQYIEMLMKIHDVITNIHDVTQGRKPAGVEAGIAIERLQEAAQSIVRLQVQKEITRFVKEVGEFIVWIMQNYEEDIVNIRTGSRENGGFGFDKMNMGMSVNEQGELVEEGGRGLRDGNFDVEVVGGTREPAGRVATEARALSLFKEGVYGIEEMVRDLAETDRTGLIERYYIRNGIKEVIQELEEFDKAMNELQGYVGRVVKDLDRIGGSGIGPEERELIIQRIRELLQQHPKLMITEEFYSLPPDWRESILEVFSEDKN